jgi:acyl dehydratase
MYLEDLQVGQSWDISPFEVTAEQIKRFAGEYDPIPLHTDEEYARSTRFGGLIASGVMMHMLLWVHLLKDHGDLFGDELIAGMENRMFWPHPTYAGDMIRGVARVAEIEVRNDYNGAVFIQLTGYNEKGECTVDGGFKAVIKRRPR